MKGFHMFCSFSADNSIAPIFNDRIQGKFVKTENPYFNNKAFSFNSLSSCGQLLKQTFAEGHIASLKTST